MFDARIISFIIMGWMKIFAVEILQESMNSKYRFWRLPMPIWLLHVEILSFEKANFACENCSYYSQHRVCAFFYQVISKYFYRELVVTGIYRCDSFDSIVFDAFSDMIWSKLTLISSIYAQTIIRCVVSMWTTLTYALYDMKLNEEMHRLHLKCSFIYVEKKTPQKLWRYRSINFESFTHWAH